MKLVILCHFSNNIIRNYLPLDGLKLEHLVYSVLGKPKREYIDFAKWVTNIITYLEGRKDIETHVISPHFGLKKKIFEFDLNNVHYHFYQSAPLFPWNIIDRKLNPSEYISYDRNRRLIRSFIDVIKPNLINLIGAENPYYSIAALDYHNIPIFLHCQTVYSNPLRKELTGSVDVNRCEVEQKLFKHIRYFACTGEMYYKLIKQYNNKAIVFPRTWPNLVFPKIPEVKKEFTFTFFARYLNINKGFDNALKAFAKVREQYPEVTMSAVGAFEPRSEHLIKNIIGELKLQNSLFIHEPFPNYADMLKFVKKSKFAVLPIKMDVISGTIFEAMRLGLPVVTHITSGTPQLNQESQTVLLSEIGDIDSLADNMCKLIVSESLASDLRNNSFAYLNKVDLLNSANTENMIKQYKVVCDNYYNNIPIPEDMLFKTVVL